MKIFVVIPAFNEEKRIGGVIRSLKGKDLPIVAVDDGSNDKTYQEALRLKRSVGNLYVLKHRVNLGKGAAMKTGAEAAFRLGADAVIFMDSDGQHSPEDLPKFINGLRESGVILGEREVLKGTSFRIYGSRFISFLANFLYGVNINDFLCGYRALTKSAYHKIKWTSSDYGVESEMIARIGKLNVQYKTVLVKSIYHDTYKGFSVIDGIKLLYNIVSWRLTI